MGMELPGLLPVLPGLLPGNTGIQSEMSIYG